MSTASVTGSATLGEDTFNSSTTQTGDGRVRRGVTLAAAKSGTLTTRSSGTAGTLTMASGHGFTNGQIIDIYWATGQCTRATIGTVATNSVPFTGAGGDALPAANTEITAMVESVEDFDIDIAELLFLGVGADNAACSATFLDDGGSVIGRVLVSRADGTGGTTKHHYIWHTDDGSADPISDDAVSVCLTHGATSSQTVVCSALVS